MILSHKTSVGGLICCSFIELIPLRIGFFNAKNKGGNMKGLLFLAHGSKVSETNETLEKYIKALAHRTDYDCVIGAYLQLMEPDLHTAIEDMVSRGVESIDIFPFFLFKGNHMLMDIPVEIEAAQINHPGLHIRMMDCIGYDEALVDLILNRLSAS